MPSALVALGFISLVFGLLAWAMYIALRGPKSEKTAVGLTIDFLRELPRVPWHLRRALEGVREFLRTE